MRHKMASGSYSIFGRLGVSCYQQDLFVGSRAAFEKVQWIYSEFHLGSGIFFRNKQTGTVFDARSGFDDPRSCLFNTRKLDKSGEKTSTMAVKEGIYASKFLLLF